MPGTTAPIHSVSLIIPTYRRERALINCIYCARQQDWSNLEVLVIDQSESHESETAHYLSTLSSPVRLIHHTPPSAVGARNRGIHESNGDLLIFIDDDTTFESSFVSQHVAAIKAGADVVQGRVIEPGRGVSYRPQWMLPWLRVIGSNTYDKSGDTNTLTGCNFSITRSAQKKIGLFDEQFNGIVIREDADFGARCFRSGLAMKFSSEACLTHHRDPSGGVDVGVKKPRRECEPDVLRNDLYFAHKHYPRMIVWQYRLRLKRRLLRIAQEQDSLTVREIDDLLATADLAARRLLKR
jgi:glycosyltransferase involved in cell wall biosynthesis